MSQNSSIEWTQKTWNPVRGCSRVSEGCRHCYAEVVAGRFCGPGLAYEGLGTRTSKGARWTGDVRVIEEEVERPLHMRKPARIFVNSMSDIFHENLSTEGTLRVFDVMARAPQHIYQILTKRSDRLAELAPQLPWRSHMWMGVSVESPQYAHRIDDLRATDAVVKFLSIEPLLAPFEEIDLHAIDWVIVGGESGVHLYDEKNRRERGLVERVGGKWMPREDRIGWVRTIRDACRAQGVAFFMKQWGGPRPKAAGRMLDGVIHDAYPPLRRSLPMV